jgi:hypothetical protein
MGVVVVVLVRELSTIGATVVLSVSSSLTRSSYDKQVVVVVVNNVALLLCTQGFPYALHGGINIHNNRRLFFDISCEFPTILLKASPSVLFRDDVVVMISPFVVIVSPFVVMISPFVVIVSPSVVIVSPSGVIVSPSVVMVSPSVVMVSPSCSIVSLSWSIVSPSLLPALYAIMLS